MTFTSQVGGDHEMLRTQGAAAFTCAIATVLALSGCGDASPADSVSNDAAALQMERVGDFLYDEGAQGYFAVEDDSGETVAEEEFEDSDVAAGMETAVSLDPGSYEVRSWMRPCLASCPEDGGSLDPPTAECSGEVTVSAGDEAHVVFEHEHDEDGDRCRVRAEG